MADDAASRARLWALREAHTEAIAAAGVPLKLDVGVPLARSRVASCARSAAPTSLGHLGDGNVHVNLLDADAAAGDAVLDLVLALRGGRSAPSTASAWRRRTGCSTPAGEAEVAAMRAIKAALDPAGLLNPGVVLR